MKWALDVCWPGNDETRKKDQLGHIYFLTGIFSFIFQAGKIVMGTEKSDGFKNGN
jgi:hypothetical protein